MFRRTLFGMSCLTVCLGSIVFQLPTQVGNSSFFGVFGSETSLFPDPVCNAIAPKMRKCREMGPYCKDVSYIAGPQSADPGGVNTLRFEKTGIWFECADPIQGDTNPPCKMVVVYQDSGKCTPVFVTED